jgi:hypothetical protein
MNQHLATRLSSIRDALMAHYKGGRGLPTVMAGSERETLLDKYLQQVLPPIYRFGRGTITDSKGGRSGGLDIVMELPFAPNFPMPAGDQRLYLAESVAAVIEVKSNLSSQWSEVESTVAAVKTLRRDLREPERYVEATPPATEPQLKISDIIPCYVVGYMGHTTIEGLQHRLASTAETCRPDGALVIDSGCFVGFTGAAHSDQGLFAFVVELVAQVNLIVGSAYPNIRAYLHGSG